MRRPCRYRLCLMLVVLCGLALLLPASAFAEPPKDMLDQLLPGESEMGIEPGDRTLDYRQYPVDNYVWDVGYDLVEWTGWKPRARCS